MAEDLSSVDLFVDKIYGGSRNKNFSDDPLPKLLKVDNGAGFRHRGKRPEVETLELLVLKTNFDNVNWPDALHPESGVFIYYGDKHEPGDLHDTPRQGNAILKNLFHAAHSSEKITNFPPILVFAGTGDHRDVRFLGLAVPGADGLHRDEELVAVWRTATDGIRFQNYKSTFTILDISTITRAWIADIQQGRAMESPHAPQVWLDWLVTRKSKALKSIPVKTTRSKLQQTPNSGAKLKLIETIYSKYQNSPTDFELCAMELARMFMPNIEHWELTRPWKDGGRDGIGGYRIGAGAGYLNVEFSLEAKCYSPKNGVGVREVSRLISRMKHRQFGVIVTTSYLSQQAYSEIIEDEHPIVVISAADIAEKVLEVFGNPRTLEIWLDQLESKK